MSCFTKKINLFEYLLKKIMTKYFVIFQLMKQYTVETTSINVWHIDEFSHTLLDNLSNGQFYTGDSYIVRWMYSVTITGKILLILLHYRNYHNIFLFYFFIFRFSLFYPFLFLNYYMYNIAFIYLFI